MPWELLFIFIIGLVLGSFLNSLVYRLAKNLPLWERSICPHCQKQLLSKDLIPLVSFFILKGKCRFCQELISWQYPLVEFLTAALFVLAYFNYGVINWYLLSDLLYIFILLFILLFDLKYYLILDQIVWPALVIAFIFNLILGYYWLGLLAAAVLGGGFFFLQYLLSRGKWVGFGDVKLGLLLGVMLGLKFLLLALFLAYVIGGIIAVILLISGRKKFGDLLPMGSFLAGAGIIALLWGDLLLKLLVGA